MPSPPSPFDDGGDLPSVGRAQEHEQAPATRRSTRPNYLFRRAIAVGGVVAVIATAAIVVGRLISSDSAASGSGTLSEEWNRVVLIDERTGLITLDDADGNEQRQITTDIRLLADAQIVDATMMTTSSSEVTVVDLDEESVESVELTTSNDGVIRPSGSALTLIANDAANARALMVHGPTQEQLDTDAWAPLAGARYDFRLARSDPSGRHILVTDSGNFQSVLFSFDRETASFFPGLALAVDESLVVTAQNVGSDATVSVFDHEGQEITSGRTSSVRAAMIVPDGVILVTVDGEIVRISTATGDTGTGETLTIGTIDAGHVATSGNRLIVTGSAGTAIIDDAGNIVGEYHDTSLSNSGLDRFAPRRSTCLVLRRSSADEIMIIDMSNGSTVAESPASDQPFATVDGCTVADPTDAGFNLIAATGVVSTETEGDLIAFAPDGTAVVIEENRRLFLTTVSSEPEAAESATEQLAEGVDIGRNGRLVSFTQL